jgi:hypothetical protein
MVHLLPRRWALLQGLPLSKPIEWNKEVRVRLVVDVTGKSDLPDATVEDLLEAAKVSGLTDQADLSLELAKTERRVRELEQVIDFISKGVAVGEAGRVLYAINQRTEQEARDLAEQQCLLLRASKLKANVSIRDMGYSRKDVTVEYGPIQLNEETGTGNLRDTLKSMLDKVEAGLTRVIEQKMVREQELIDLRKGRS